MTPADNLVVLVVSLLVGGIGIYVGASVLASARNYSHAVVTAGIGAIVWSVVSVVVGGVPLLGPLLTLLAYLLVVKWRYGTSWLTAGGIAAVSWITALVVLWLLAAVGATQLSAVGIPNV